MTRKAIALHLLFIASSWPRASINNQQSTIGNYLADGLFMDSGFFHVMPDVSLAPLEELFRARVITFLVKKELLPPERARMLRSWKHSGFNIHRSQRVPPRNREDPPSRFSRSGGTSMERLAREQAGGRRLEAVGRSAYERSHKTEGVRVG